MLFVLVALVAASPVPPAPASPDDTAATNGAEVKENERPVVIVENDGVAPPSPDSLVDDLFAGRWLDPSEPYWKPRRGERIELSALFGGEAAFEAVSTDKLPSLGGVVLTLVGRYYPVDRLAVVIGGRTYLGLDGVPAAGTTASSVVSLIAGIRYDLVRENRFSLMWDLYSGPSLYAFADLPEDLALGSAVGAAGGEMGTGLALRYSVGPITGEARGVVGGRAGAAANPFGGTAGPFSAAYAGIEIGFTWSMQ